jgi:serpin B
MTNMKSIALFPIILLAACTPSSAAENVQPLSPTSAEARTAAASVDAFAADLHAALPKEGNLFYSPTSIAVALSMTSQGARGATKDEMDKVLHTPPSVATYAALMARYAQSKSPEIAIANRAYMDGSLAIEPDFAKVAPMEAVDFVHQAEGARGKINAWVSDRTKTRIPDLIAPRALDEDTRFVIVNAIYFKGDWATAFDPKATHDDTFHGATDQKTPTMHAMLPASLGSHAGAQVLDLAYKAKDGPETSMTVLLPEANHTLAEVEAAYVKEGLAPFVSSASSGDVDVALPKMKMSTDFELANTLGALGMPTAFSDSADFTGITHTDPLKIGKVIHKAFVLVNEEGTEAAAATAVVGVKATAVMMPLAFHADHPFVFFVRDRATGVVLFAGRYVTPV